MAPFRRQGSEVKKQQEAFEHQSSLQSIFQQSLPAAVPSPRSKVKVGGHRQRSARREGSTVEEREERLKGHGQPSKSSGQSSVKGKSSHRERPEARFRNDRNSQSGFQWRHRGPISHFRIQSGRRPLGYPPRHVLLLPAPILPLVRRGRSGSAHQVSKEPKRQLSLRIESNPSKSENPAAVDNNKSVSQKRIPRKRRARQSVRWSKANKRPGSPRAEGGTKS
ncbi:hypothetical protein BSL78_22202 [Apostichopus japonicus]|uniref:Uncharacterized protein n=1 Tax=Stichopus japonicus TaxID=307972 RepID=A0A2G8JYV0_STIJA|nr:hypothetical protein BSL78_22202 [Apostichopus japonicus]